MDRLLTQLTCCQRDLNLIYNQTRTSLLFSFGEYASFAISSNGEYIAAGTWGSNKDKKVYLFDKDTSTPLWSYETGGQVLSTPAVVGGVVYFGSYDGYLYALVE